MLSKRFYASSFLFDNMRIMFLDTSLTKRWRISAAPVSADYFVHADCKIKMNRALGESLVFSEACFQVYLRNYLFLSSK